MTESPHPWDRLSTETDLAFEAFSSYLETGSMLASYRQSTGKKKAKFSPGTWTAWGSKHNWVRRRAAYVDATIRDCQDSLQEGLVRVRLKFVNEAEKLLDREDLAAKRLASDIIRAHFPPVQQVEDVSEQIEDLSDIPDADMDRMREIRDSARAKANAQSQGDD